MDAYVLNAEANKEVQTRRVYKLWSGIHIAKLPSQLETIREQAYSGVKELAHLQIPSGVKTIGSKAFAECAELKSVYLPASVSDIAKDAFYGCHELTLYVEAGTAAEKYASSLGIPYYCVK